jgi:rhodanese-related sulfurtransferase
MHRGLGLILCAVLVSVAGLSAQALAQSAGISEARPSFTFTLNGQSLRIDRTGPQCPPRCVQPMLVAPGVASIGELEVVDFLELFVMTGRGLLLDARLPDAFVAETLPGAVNLPAATLNAANPYRDDLLSALGVRNEDYSQAFDLVVFAAGPDDPGAAEALRGLLDSGYPATKLKYYRGGLDAWRAIGLTVAGGQ